VDDPAEQSLAYPVRRSGRRAPGHPHHRTLASALYQVKPFDAVSYIAAVLGVVLVSLVASTIPAQRAARLDPAKALRAE